MYRRGLVILLAAFALAGCGSDEPEPAAQAPAAPAATSPAGTPPTGPTATATVEPAATTTPRPKPATTPTPTPSAQRPKAVDCIAKQPASASPADFNAAVRRCMERHADPAQEVAAPSPAERCVERALGGRPPSPKELKNVLRECGAVGQAEPPPANPVDDCLARQGVDPQAPPPPKQMAEALKRCA